MNLGESARNRILFVDDEPNILEAFQRQFRKRFDVDIAVGAEPAIAQLSTDGPYAVIVSDMRMPGMTGIQFLARAKEISPDSVRIMLTGHADTAAAIGAINQAGIFRFLNKPCLPEVLTKTIEAALDHYRLAIAERMLLEQTLRGSIEVLTEILSLSSPAAFSQTARIREYVCYVTAQLGRRDAWKFEVAAMLSHIGCITVTPAILAKVAANEPLAELEHNIFKAHPRVGQELLAKIPRLEGIAQMVGRQHEACDGPGESDEDEIRLGARILRAVIDLDHLRMAGRTHTQAMDEMRARADYNGHVLEALAQFNPDRIGKEVRHMRVKELAPGMIVDQDVQARNGLLLLARGQIVTESVIARLESFVMTQGVPEPLRVLATREEVLAI